jgi:hypothetical protein
MVNPAMKTARIRNPIQTDIQSSLFHRTDQLIPPFFPSIKSIPPFLNVSIVTTTTHAINPAVRWVVRNPLFLHRLVEKKDANSGQTEADHAGISERMGCILPINKSVDDFTQFQGICTISAESPGAGAGNCLIKAVRIHRAALC